MSHLTSQQIDTLRHNLLQEKAELERSLSGNNNYGLSTPMNTSVGELSGYDNHPGDLATEMYDRGKDIALNEHTEHHVIDIEAALARMDSGEYGVCAVCGKSIPYERLEAVPTTMYCFDHVPDRDVSDRRPAEERFLKPPFGRTSFDGNDGETEFDGEDAWQAVEKWGTSNTPAMAESANVEDYNDMYTEAEEPDGYVEPIESFLATDLYGNNVTVVRNRAYHEYMANNEGEPLLEPDPYKDE